LSGIAEFSSTLNQSHFGSYFLRVLESGRFGLGDLSEYTLDHGPALTCGRGRNS